MKKIFSQNMRVYHEICFKNSIIEMLKRNQMVQNISVFGEKVRQNI